jgi:hypothetical protein
MSQDSDAGGELSHRLTQWVSSPNELALVTAQLRKYGASYELRQCEGQYAIFVSELRVEDDKRTGTGRNGDESLLNGF